MYYLFDKTEEVILVEFPLPDTGLKISDFFLSFCVDVFFQPLVCFDLVSLLLLLYQTPTGRTAYLNRSLP